jgi:hypothetical protein
MRVCHPGPVAFQRAMTSAGSRSDISFLGFSERGRPPFFTLARASVSDVSSGSSRYSLALTTCASTRARSDFKVRREAFLFAAIGFPHAENVATLAPRDVTNHDHASLEMPVTDNASLAIVLARVFNLHRNAGKNDCGISKSRPRSAKVLARLAGSQVIRMGYRSYKNMVGQPACGSGSEGT